MHNAISKILGQLKKQ